MREAAVRELLDSEQALLAALDGDDPAAIEIAAQAVGEAIEKLKSLTPQERAHQVDMLREALALAETGRRQTNMLADKARTRIDRLARIGGIERAPTRYGRTGRLQG